MWSALLHLSSAGSSLSFLPWSVLIHPLPQVLPWGNHCVSELSWARLGRWCAVTPTPLVMTAVLPGGAGGSLRVRKWGGRGRSCAFTTTGVARVAAGLLQLGGQEDSWGWWDSRGPPDPGCIYGYCALPGMAEISIKWETLQRKMQNFRRDTDS